MIPLVVIGVFGVSIGLFSLLWQLSIWVHPENAGMLRDVMGGSQRQFSQFLVTLPCILASIPLGMLFANCVAWCIPAARRTFEREAKGVRRASFRASMSGLGKFTMYVVPICVALGVVGALTLR